MFQNLKEVKNFKKNSKEKDILKPLFKFVRVFNNEVKKNENSKDYDEVINAFKVIVHTIVIPLFFATFVSILSAVMYYILPLLCIVSFLKRKENILQLLLKLNYCYCFGL